MQKYITEIVRNDSYLPNILEVNSFIRFLSKNPKDLLIKTSEIINETVGNHYINFIYKPKHQHYIDILSKEIEEYQK